ncbi:hypothetical protein [Guptibacillus hwajinpoensis]|uniref:hypothetical protein n=1 Tax=Guptibacillus hwajinpoensis TaxID=208199 RepID=UPI0024B3BFF0|nr:hypothetical protein [Pseudalkalibacillus hwajinpoensis]
MTIKRLGLDIDGTVTSPKTFLPYLNSSFNKQLSLHDITQYNLANLLGIPQKEFFEWLKTNEEKIYANALIADQAHPILEEWKVDYELFYISARGNHLLNTTKDWFTSNAVPYHHIELIGKHDKIDSIKEHSVDVFFEDKYDNACAIAEECEIPVILFDTPYNQGTVPSNVSRLETWPEAQQWLKHHNKSGRA